MTPGARLHWRSRPEIAGIARVLRRRTDGVSRPAAAPRRPSGARRENRWEGLRRPLARNPFAMDHDAPIPQTLLVHEGDLADVRALLASLDAPCVERLGALAPEDSAAEWGLVIAPPEKMLRLHDVSAETRIAVMSQDSRTLRNSLRRAGIQLLVRRPVHPATMRALVVHALYQGPEKRRMRRVNVGAPVTYRAGWRQRPAVLVDLSLGGCRLLTDRRLARDASLTLHVPASVSGDKAFAVKGAVLRSERDDDGRYCTTARFGSLESRVVAKLEGAVRAHVSGPAAFEGAASLAGAAQAPRGCVAPSPSRQASEVREAPPAVERRERPRHRLERRVISLSEEATRVLMGRDITLGGMRVNRHPNLEVGTDVLLAIHAAEKPTPLVVRARVHRDDRERGMVLRFHQLTPEASAYLNHVMDHLPLVDAGDEGNGCLVTEILEAV